MHIEAPNVSGYVAEAAAQTRSEAEARAAKIGEKGQRTFLSVVKTASDLTAAGLPPGKTVAQAVARAIELRDELWSHAGWMRRPEDERLDELDRLCTKLYGGDAVAGQLLASLAIWS